MAFYACVALGVPAGLVAVNLLAGPAFLPAIAVGTVGVALWGLMFAACVVNDANTSALCTLLPAAGTLSISAGATMLVATLL